jgi:hypothetical protein
MTEISGLLSSKWMGPCTVMKKTNKKKTRTQKECFEDTVKYNFENHGWELLGNSIAHQAEMVLSYKKQTWTLYCPVSRGQGTKSSKPNQS